MPTLKHKFDINETVYVIRCRSKEVREPCPDCTTVSLDRNKFSCRGCASRGYIPHWVPDVWMIDGPYTIGQITIVKSRPREHYKALDEVRYMMHETGVVSGTNYNELDLVRGEERARKECARRQKIDDEKKALQESSST